LILAEVGNAGEDTGEFKGNGAKMLAAHNQTSQPHFSSKKIGTLCGLCAFVTETSSVATALSTPDLGLAREFR